MNEMVASAVLEALADPRLLTAEQFTELSERMYPLCPDWQILGPEIVYRGWLSTWQMQQVLEGHGRSLALGSYVLLEPLAEGGMGRVFKARNWKLGKIVALKVIRHDLAQNEAVVRRFRREIRGLSRATHPNIVHVFDADVSGSTLFYAMEYVPGIDLGRLVQQTGRLDVAHACHYVAQAAQALQHAHLLGLVHRDIKPTNLLLEPETQTIKLLDLGLVFDLADEQRSQLTRLNSLVGTPDFVAPEQIHDSHAVDIRSDLYSLGCTFFYLLTGQAPFEKEETVDKLYCHVREEAPPIDQLRPDVPRELAAIIRRLLAKSPQDRFQEPVELLETLLPFVNIADGEAFPTVSNSGSKTEPKLPVVAVEGPLPPTQVVSASELGVCSAPDEELAAEPLVAPRVEESRPSLPAWLQTAIAMLLALGALALVWKLGLGPGGSPAP